MNEHLRDDARLGSQLLRLGSADSVPGSLRPEGAKRETGTRNESRENQVAGTKSRNQVVARGTVAAQSNGSAGNVRGASRDPLRGEWCTPRWLAEAVGPWDLDPFSNARSHVVATHACWLERGDDGFGDGTPGSYYRAKVGQSYADASTRVWIQPPYARGFVSRVFEHYGHTRFCALLRFDPRPPWFDAFYNAAELVAVLRRTPDGKPFGFEPPPGVTASSNTFPHALFYRRAEDATPEVLRHCAAWRKARR